MPIINRDCIDNYKVPFKSGNMAHAYIPGLEKMMWKDCEFEDNLGYIIRSFLKQTKISNIFNKENSRTK